MLVLEKNVKAALKGRIKTIVKKCIACIICALSAFAAAGCSDSSDVSGTTEYSQTFDATIPGDQSDKASSSAGTSSASPSSTRSSSNSSNSSSSSSAASSALTSTATPSKTSVPDSTVLEPELLVPIEPDSGTESSAEPVKAVSWDEWTKNISKGETCDYIEFDEDPYGQSVLFYTETPVSNFAVYRPLNFEISEDGVLSYDATMLISRAELLPERPLNIMISCPGDLPLVVLGYAGENDSDFRLFSISISGYDGSYIIERLPEVNEDPQE